MDFLSQARSWTGDMVDLVERLASIESPSDDSSAVGAMARALEPLLADVGLDVEELPVTNAGPLLVAGRGHDHPIMLLGHMDTVWPLGTLEHLPVRREGNRLYGPGTYDMKAGLVVALFALHLLRRCGRFESVPLQVVVTPLEEADSNRYRPLLDKLCGAARAVLGFEPAWPGGAVKTARKGTARYTLRVLGRPSHAGADPAKGISAVLELAHQLVRIADLAVPEEGITINAGVVEGGTAVNVVAAEALARLDVRFWRAADARRIDEALHQLTPVLPGARLEVTGGAGLPPLERIPGVGHIYEAVRRAAVAVGLDPPGEASSGGGSEVAVATAVGTPAIDGLGPDGDGAHATYEHVLIPTLAERAALVAQLLLDLSTDPVLQP